MINLFIHTATSTSIQLVSNPEEIEFIYIDLFCGAGGTSTGLHNAKVNGKQVAIIAACVNHDPNAINSHWANYPEVLHFEEDIRTLDLTPLVDLINKYRDVYEGAKIVLWASLECTNFSKAKGGQSRDADSRTLAEHLYRYVSALDPDYIQIENVVEFMSWGPLRIACAKTHRANVPDLGIYPYSELKASIVDGEVKYAMVPESKDNGKYFLRWRKQINSYGYRDDWNEMNSADYGAYTSRNRLFGCFAKDGLPIVWPEPTHSKKPQNADLFGAGLKKWKAVKDVLDFEDQGVSIFDRKKPLSPKTLERIYAGLIKYVAGGKESFLSVYNSGNPKSRNTSIDEPCRTVLTANTFGFVKASFLAKYFSGKPEGKVISTNGPAGAITTSANTALVLPSFLMKYYGNGDNVQSIDQPAGTVTTKDRFTKIQCMDIGHPLRASNRLGVFHRSGSYTEKKYWLDKTYTGTYNHQSVECPAGVVMVNDHHQLVHANPFIMVTSYGNIGKSINEPAPPLLASRRHHYIINPSHGGNNTSTEKPCPVIVARQDKAPLYLAQTEHGEMICFDASKFFIEEDYDFLNGVGTELNRVKVEPSIRVKIVEFMVLYGISDIKMRMLKVNELKLIQGFPKSYVLNGTQTDQKKFIGNSVVPHVVKSWTETLAIKLRQKRKAA